MGALPPVTRARSLALLQLSPPRLRRPPRLCALRRSPCSPSHLSWLLRNRSRSSTRPSASCAPSAADVRDLPLPLTRTPQDSALTLAHTACLPRPDNASSAPFRTPIPLSGASPVVLRTVADNRTVYDSAIVWGENPITLSTGRGNVTLANGTEYWYDTTVFDDQRAAREEGQVRRFLALLLRDVSSLTRRSCSSASRSTCRTRRRPARPTSRTRRRKTLESARSAPSCASLLARAHAPSKLTPEPSSLVASATRRARATRRPTRSCAPTSSSSTATRSRTTSPRTRAGRCSRPPPWARTRAARVRGRCKLAGSSAPRQQSSGSPYSSEGPDRSREQPGPVLRRTKRSPEVLLSMYIGLSFLNGERGELVLETLFEKVDLDGSLATGTRSLAPFFARSSLPTAASCSRAVKAGGCIPAQSVQPARS